MNILKRKNAKKRESKSVVAKQGGYTKEPLLKLYFNSCIPYVFWTNLVSGNKEHRAQQGLKGLGNLRSWDHLGDLYNFPDLLIYGSSLCIMVNLTEFFFSPAAS